MLLKKGKFKGFKDVLCSFFYSIYMHNKTTSFPEMALELLSNFKSYSYLKFSQFFTFC